MKRTIAWLLCLCLALSLAGCGGRGGQPASASTSSGAAGSGQGALKVEEELFDVTLTIPAEFMEGITQQELDQQVAAGELHEATLNEDGSVTCVISKRQHQELLAGIAETINTSLEEMVGSEEFPGFVRIEANEDFTSFTVTTTSAELSLPESFSVVGFYLFGGTYGAFSGNEPDNIHVEFVNADTGEVISSADSKDME